MLPNDFLQIYTLPANPINHTSILFYFSFIMDFRKQHLDAFVKKYGIKFGFMSAFCKATAYALQDQPVVNAVIEENVRFF